MAVIPRLGELGRGDAQPTGDVVVLGAGVSGLSFAFRAAQAGRRVLLPSPRLGHHEIVREITAALVGQRLALTGNYFDGLAIEDCVQRSFGEWARVARGGARA